MVFKGLITAVAAIGLAVTPTMAAASQAAAAAAAATPATETVDMEGNELRGGWFIPLIAIIAILLGLWAALDDGNDQPTSP